MKAYSGGSEAIEAALKFVRQYFKQTGHPGKYKFISRYFGYHGGTFGGMAASGTGPRKTKFEPQMAGFVKVFPPSYYRDRFATWEEANRFAAESFEDVIVARGSGDGGGRHCRADRQHRRHHHAHRRSTSRSSARSATATTSF